MVKSRREQTRKDESRGASQGGQARGRAWDHGEFWVSLVIAAASAYLLFVVRDFPSHQFGVETPGPGLFPGILLVGLIGTSTFLVVGSLIRRSNSTSGEDEEHQHNDRAVLGSLIMVAYALLIPLLGYYVSTSLFLVALPVSLGWRRWRPLAVYAALFLLFVSLLFGLGFNTRLPSGLVG